MVHFCNLRRDGGAGGILLSSRMNSASSVYGDNTGMLVNCGVVIGGTSFAGGIGGVVQSFIGVFVLR